jgi:hypothetical protein
MGNLRGRYAKLNAGIIDNTLKRAQRKNEQYRNSRGLRPMTKGEFRYCAMRDLGLLEEYYEDFE